MPLGHYLSVGKLKLESTLSEGAKSREWHGLSKPVRVTGTGTKGYGCGYRLSDPQNPHVPLL
jgi:hypothetical protein